jgi:tRNA pseudouridine13 synthase
MPSVTDNLTYLTPDLPGIGGVIKEKPEDFLVEEQPLYEPSGEGEHLYLYIEKRERTTTDVIRRLAKSFRVGKGDIGYAGLKDKRAVTRQHFSIYLPNKVNDAELLANVDCDSVKTLWAARHNNKLRRGHHAGNRFVIYVRQVEPTAVVRAKPILDRLTRSGAPNYVGEQRFGYRGDNAELGRLLLLERWSEFIDLLLGQPREADYAPTRAGREAYERKEYAAALEAWPRHHRPERQALDALRQGKAPRNVVLAIDPQQRDFLISAWQSDIFNRVMDRRLRDGLFDRLVEGDLAWKHDSRAVFAVDGTTAEQENAAGGRVATLGVSPSGPMWGAGMTKPAGQVLAWETEALAQTGIDDSRFAGGSHVRAEGSRRPMRTPIKDPAVSGGVDERGPYVRLSFELGRGSFATALLREIMKTTGAAAAEEGSEA